MLKKKASVCMRYDRNINGVASESGITLTITIINSNDINNKMHKYDLLQSSIRFSLELSVSTSFPQSELCYHPNESAVYQYFFSHHVAIIPATVLSIHYTFPRLCVLRFVEREDE